MTDLPTDPVLAKVRSELDAMYGDRIERIVLFGSRARGDATDESDYDVAVFLHGLTDRWRELGRLADLRVQFMDGGGPFVDFLPYPAGAYRERLPIMHEIRLDGRDL